MCNKCDQYDEHMATLKEIAEKHPEYKDKLEAMIKFLEIEQDMYVDAAVERDLND